jgi:cytidine deaminase
MTDKELLDLAWEAREQSYSPYSGFAVGAALECEDGTVYLGCNVEGASYGNTICAERTALVKAVSEGKRSFKRIAIVANSPDYTAPCGICRQMLYEFAPDLQVLCANGNRAWADVSLRELLPMGFSASSMEK